MANGFRSQRMLGVRIGMMMMVMPMIVPMIVPMIMTMMMVVPLVKTASPGAEMIAQRAILDIATRCRDTLSLDMMVVAFLGKAHLVLKPQNLRPVFAQGAVHVVLTIKNFADTVGKSGDHLRMIVQIAGLDECSAGMGRRHLVGETIDAVNQDPGKQEIGKDDNALESKLHHMLKTGLHQREGHTGIANLGPAESHAFPQHP